MMNMDLKQPGNSTTASTTGAGTTKTPWDDLAKPAPEAIVIPKEQLDYSDFTKLYSENEIRNDSNYIVSTVKSIKGNKDRYDEELDRLTSALVLEQIITPGILRYDWLGLEKSDAEVSYIHLASKPRDSRHCIDRYRCLSFDDSAHKIDSAFQLEFPNSDISIPIGLDLTTLDDANGLNWKLIHSHNRRDLDNLPRGFSAIKYGYTSPAPGESALCGNLSMVPRFIVGTDGRHIKQLNGFIGRDNRGTLVSTLDDVKFDPKMLAIRFKILSEIHEQVLMNKYYLRGHEKNSEASPILNTIGERVRDSLESTIDEIPDYFPHIPIDDSNRRDLTDKEKQAIEDAKTYNNRLDQLWNLTDQIAEEKEAGNDPSTLQKERYELAVKLFSNQFEPNVTIDGKKIPISAPDRTYHNIIAETRSLYPSLYQGV